MDRVCQIDDNGLYSQIQKAKIPFHLWHKWLEQSLSRQYMEKLYAARQQQRAKLIQENPSVKKDISHTGYFSPFTIKNDFFRDYFCLKKA